MSKTGTLSYHLRSCFLSLLYLVFKGSLDCGVGTIKQLQLYPM